jgi:hypothetical protein
MCNFYQRILGTTKKTYAVLQQEKKAWISASALDRMACSGKPLSMIIELKLEMGSFD